MIHMSDRKHEDGRPDGQLLVDDRVATVRPPMYRVVLLNDDFTPMDFVVWILKTIFHHPDETAVRLMLDVHQKGMGICGVFPFDVARTKAAQVKGLAEKNEHPLRCEVEPAGA